MPKKHGKHQTVPKELKPGVAWLRDLEGVSKIVLGRTENCRTRFSAGHVSLTADIPAGFKARGYFGAGIVDMCVYISDQTKREGIRKAVEERFGD
jgi:hypothetical protein